MPVRYANQEAERVLQRLKERRNSNQPPALTTGIQGLDNLLGGGLYRGEVTYLVGQTGVGKSYLTLFNTLSAADWCAKAGTDTHIISGYVPSAEDPEIENAVEDKEGKSSVIVYWNLEMPLESVIIRMLCQVAHMYHNVLIDNQNLRNADLGRPGQPLVGKEDSPEFKVQDVGLDAAFETFQKLGSHIVLEFNSHTIPELERLLKYLVIEHDIVLIVIDYFRKIRVPNAINAAEKQAIRSAYLTDISKKYDAPILCIFDITKSAQQKDVITMEAMRDGAAAMFDADNILVLNELNASPNSRHSRLRISIEKQRWGMEGEVDIYLDKATGYIEEERREDINVSQSENGDDTGVLLDSLR